MQSENDTRFTHLNARGEARMVDIGEKALTRREAVAESYIYMKPETLDAIISAQIKKGDVIAAARIAGIMAAKRTHELLPLCHSIPVDSVEVLFAPNPPGSIHIRATVKCSFKTGAEMEALTAASVAALTVYDMCKSIDKGMEIGKVRLVKKTGGKSGEYERA